MKVPVVLTMRVSDDDDDDNDDDSDKSERCAGIVAIEIALKRGIGLDLTLDVIIYTLFSLSSLPIG